MIKPSVETSEKVELFFDGACPLCAREVSGLRRLDRGRGNIAMTDIAAPGFDAGAVGKKQEDLMARIHARLPDGTWIEGMEAFRRVYGAVGLRWLLAPTGWPGLRRVADAAYRLFARNRLRWTGRASCGERSCEVTTSDDTEN